MGKTTREKIVEEELNYSHYKEGYISYKKFVGKMARYFIDNCDRGILIKALKKRKIIKRDWEKDGEKYSESDDRGKR